MPEHKPGNLSGVRRKPAVKQMPVLKQKPAIKQKPAEAHGIAISIIILASRLFGKRDIDLCITF